MSAKIDLSEIKALAESVSEYGEAVRRAEYRAVNKVAAKEHTAAKKKIASAVNLSPSYVGENLTLKPAQLGEPTAVITGRFRPTKLSTYGAKLVLAPAPRSRGNPKIGLPAGSKATGVSVSVKRGGARKVMNNAFLLELKSGNGLGVFTREGGRLKHHYGPSVDQGLTLYIRDNERAIGEDLEKTFLAQVEFEIGEVKK